MTTPTKFQPVLPAPLTFTEAELNFSDEEPPNFFPDNQNSNWGLHRRVFSNQMQKMIDQCSTLYNEMFIDTSFDLLTMHESEAGLPEAPSGKTVQQRRELVKARKRTGPFTDERVRDIIEGLIFSTYGEAIQFTPSGIPFVAGGIPFFSGEPGSLRSLYRVYYDYRNFAYEIWIKNTVGPDTVALTREINRITPSGIAATIDTTKTDVLDYARLIRNLQPQAHWQLNNAATDFSGNGNTGTFVNAPTNVAALVAAAAGGGSAMSFNGTNQSMFAADSVSLTLGDKFSVEMWIKPASLAGNPRLYSKGGSSFEIYLNTAGQIRLQVPGTALVVAETNISNALVVGSTYYIVVQHDGTTSQIFINGVDRTNLTAAATFANNTNAVVMGKLQGSNSNFYSGVMDELVVYNRLLTQAEITEHYNTGLDIP